MRSGGTQLVHELDTRLIRVRKECIEISWGECEVMECDTPTVLVLHYWFSKAARWSHFTISALPRRPCASKLREAVADASSTSSAMSTAARTAAAPTRSRWTATATAGTA